MESPIISTLNESLSILSFIFESVWAVFLSFLSNLEIGKLDLVLTNKSLRKLYFRLVDEFYLTNKICGYKELDWILNKNISLTKCHLEFKFKGKSYSIILYFCHVIDIYNSI